MARDESDAPDRKKQTRRPQKPNEDASDSPGAFPDLIRRAMTMGLSSFFSTEEAIRRALGETVPQDWVDFAAFQSDRARAEFLDRLVAEFGRVLESTDLGELADRVLDGRTVEVTIRVGSRESDDTPSDGKAPRSKSRA